MRRRSAASVSVLLLFPFLPLSCAVPEPTDPEFSTAEEADLDPMELVIGLQVGDEVKAYPISAMAPLEILNDRIGGMPVAVTWCPLSASSAVFDRTVADSARRFVFHPDLYKMNLLVYDEETESQWSQLAMGAIVGELEGTPLPLLPSIHTTWEHWLALHPQTLVMDPIWGSRDFHYRPAGDPGPDGLGEKSLVHVVPAAGEIRAYPLDGLARSEGPWVDGRGKEEILLHYDPRGPAAWASNAAGEVIPGITMYRAHVSDFYPNAIWPMAEGKPEAGQRGEYQGERAGAAR